VVRLILALAVVLAAVPAFAQAEAEWTAQNRREEARQRREEARQRREEVRQQREEAREQAREQREERRQARRQQWEEWTRDGRSGVHFRMMRDYHLPAGSTAAEPIIVLGGNATIDGHTEDDVVVFGGTVRVGPKAVVDGEVVTVGGEAIIDPAATVRGGVDTTSFTLPDIDWGPGWPAWGWRDWWPFAALSATVLRLSLVLIISMLITVVAPGWIRSMGIRASSAVTSGLVGAVAEVLFVPALLAVMLGLTISIVGIPLLGAIPFALALAALAWTGGFAAVAICLGARLRGSSVATSSALMADLLIGFVAITALTIIAHVISLGPGWMTPFGWMSRAVGFAVEYVAWTVGLGAALSGRFVKSSPMPPPVPVSATL
jgi:hypothetical protein